MVAAAEKAGVVTQLGFNYLKNPLIFLARDIIESGEIGEIRSFRGVHAEDFMTRVFVRKYGFSPGAYAQAMN